MSDLSIGLISCSIKSIHTHGLGTLHGGSGVGPGCGIWTKQDIHHVHERSNNIGVTTRIAVKSSEIEEIE